METFIIEKNLNSGREPVFTGSDAGKTLCCYTPDGEGGGYYALTTSLWTTGEIQESALVRQHADGTEIYRLDFGVENLLNASLAADGSGRVFLLAEDFLYVVGADGKLIAEIEGSRLGAEFDSGRGSLQEGEDGSVYYIPFSAAANAIYEISGDDAAFRGGTFKMKRIEVPSINGRCYDAQQGIMYSGSDGMLYQYRRKDSRWEELLRFGDSNLQRMPEQMLLLSEEHLAAYYASPDYNLYLLTMTDASQLPEQKELVLAYCTQLLPDMEKYIQAFNRESGYHVTVEEVNWTNEAEFDARMLSSNPPDIILFGNDNVLKYAQKGILEDIGAYLDESTVLDRDDFLENVIEAYTIDGRLICIPKYFEIRTVIGRAAQVGTEPGWTAEEAMAFAEAHPEAQLFITPTFTSMVAFFQEDILNRYIDWESGECSFDGDDFRTFVKWVEVHSDGFGNGYAGSAGDSWNYESNSFPEDQLLCLEAMLTDFGKQLLYEMRFGEDITPVGFPTSDGSVLHTAYVYNAMGISAKSGNKSAAWQFVEGFLSQDKWDSYIFPSTFFSTQKALLMERAEKMATIVYERDGNGEISLYKAGEHEGEPVMAEKGRISFEGETIPYYYLTQEQVDTVLEIIENIDFTSRREGVRYNAISILMEELGPYIEGQRSLEESTRILQNRVQNMVQEKM